MDNLRYAVFVLMWLFITFLGGYHLGKLSIRENLGPVGGYVLLALYVSLALLLGRWLFQW